MNLAAMNVIDIFLVTLFLIICVLLIIVVLLQKGRGGGLGAAFGGAASSAFGTRVGDVFTWVTIVLTALFLLLAVGTTMWFRPSPGQVAHPVFTPPPDESYTEPIDVTITCETLGVKIYYTLDGSVPDEQSTPYESPVRVEPGTQLVARAYRSGGWEPSRPAGGWYGPAPEIEETTTLPAITGEEEIQPASQPVDAVPAM
ncbi:MAG: preprotein translocase subunit SecG [Planctomycetota bacterium]|jgi:preprotein translocase subunit SecG